MSEFKVGDRVIYKCINGDRMGGWLPDNTEATVVSCDSCGYEVIKHPTIQLFSEKLNQYQWTYEINCTKIEEEPMGKEHTFKVGDKVIVTGVLDSPYESEVIEYQGPDDILVHRPDGNGHTASLHAHKDHGRDDLWWVDESMLTHKEQSMNDEHTFKVGDHVELIREGSELTSTHVSLWNKGVVRKGNDEWYANKLGLVLVVFNTTVGPRAQWVNPVNLRLVKEEKKEDHMLTKLKEKVAYYKSRLAEAKRKAEEYQGFLNWLDQ